MQGLELERAAQEGGGRRALPRGREHAAAVHERADRIGAAPAQRMKSRELPAEPRVERKHTGGVRADRGGAIGEPGREVALRGAPEAPCALGTLTEAREQRRDLHVQRSVLRVGGERLAVARDGLPDPSARAGAIGRGDDLGARAGPAAEEGHPRHVSRSSAALHRLHVATGLPPRP